MSALNGNSIPEKFYTALHHNLIWLIIASYGFAIMLPQAGLWIRSVSFGSTNLLGHAVDFSLPPMLLATLLFNAGLGTKLSELKKVRAFVDALMLGVVGNIFVPLTFIVVLSFVIAGWHNGDEAQQILVGLAIVASMPIAGASTAWAQNSSGNMSLSLGLVLLTTFLSPLLTPVILHAVGYVTFGDYSEDLHELASGSAVTFLGAWVIAPSLFGILVRVAIGERMIGQILVWVRMLNLIVLLTLNYANASISLPEIRTNPDLDFIALSLVIVAFLCALMFLAGFYLSRFFRLQRSEAASLMFGLGMNNNGSGLVLASMSLSDHPRVMFPLILYTLVQHLGAALVDRKLS